MSENFATEKISYERPRVITLDALRGLAALFVVIGHITGGTTFSNVIENTPLFVIRAGHEAVIFFFLLSGYVLVYQYGLSPSFNYQQFVIARFLRLYVPYLISIVLGFLLFNFSKHDYDGLIFLSDFWHESITAPVLWGHLFFIGSYNVNAINPVIWSLVQEMRISLVFPVLLWLLHLPTRKATFVSIAIWFCSAVTIVYVEYISGGPANSIFYTAYYLYMFVLGGLVAKHQFALIAWYNGRTGKQKKMLLIAALLLLAYAHNTVMAIANRVYLPGLVRSRIFLEDMMIVLASVFIMIAAIALNGRRTFLENQVYVYLGKISYSLYLVHFPIIMFAYYSLRSILPIWIVLLIGFIASICIAVVFNKLVERTSIKWARKLARRK